ncbi:MAG: ion transporter [Candidatus Gracilibacteria bacterium]|nr:ion transporter [Candidatus Gracilibacteria bacterium]
MVEQFRSVLTYNKEQYENILDDPNSNIGRFFDMCILVLIMFFPFLLIFESIGNNSIRYGVELLYFDAFVSSAFMFEYMYRFVNSRNKIKFLFSPMRIIELLSFLPFFLGLVAVGDFLKLLRITRLFRVFKLVKRIPLTDGFIKSLKNYSDEYKAVFTLYAMILFLGSFFVYYLEKDVAGTGFTSLGLSMWWGVVTMSTVGYGDMSPISDLGKLIGSVLVFIGPIMGALIGAITIMVFMESSENDNILNRHTKLKECHRCRTLNPRIANFCLKCGEGFYVPHD